MFRANNWRNTPSPGGLPYALMWLTINAFFVGLIVALVLSSPPDTSGCTFPADYLFSPDQC